MQKLLATYFLRAASEPNFRRLLLSEPTKVLADYDISSEAKSIIKNVIDEFSVIQRIVKMSPASDPLLFTGSLLHSCVFPPSVLSNGDNKGDCRRIYLNNTMSRAMSHIMLHKKIFQKSHINGLSSHL